MQVRFLRDWKAYRTGRVINPPDGMANVLLRRRIVEPVDGAAAQGEPALAKRRRAKRKGDEE